MSTKESANGWPTCMVLAHIDDVTREASRGSRRARRRKAWFTLTVVMLALIGLLLITLLQAPQHPPKNEAMVQKEGRL